MDPQTETFLLEVVKVVAPLVAAFIAYLTLREQGQTRQHVKTLEQSVNGYTNEVVKQAAQAAHQAGVATGVTAVLAAEGKVPLAGVSGAVGDRAGPVPDVPGDPRQ